MTSIAIAEMDPDEFGVEIEEGDQRTGHLVIVPPALIDDLALFEVEPTLLIPGSGGFLLDREPATSFGERFSLDEIPRRHPGFYDELKTRLSVI